MDIVYLVKDTETNEELVYSLRTLVNIPHDKVFLVGGCPKEINKENIIHIPTRQTPDKHKNTTLSLQIACLDERISEEFILMNDDFFILKPIHNPHTELNLNRGTIREVLNECSKQNGAYASSYIIGMRQTMIFLEDLGIKDPLSYELHIPTVMAKNRVLQAFRLPGIRSLRVMHKRSIYGNLFQKGGQKTADVKIRRKDDKINRESKFLSTADDTWPIVKPFIHGLFPGKGGIRNLKKIPKKLPWDFSPPVSSRGRVFFITYKKRT